MSYLPVGSLSQPHAPRTGPLDLLADMWKPEEVIANLTRLRKLCGLTQEQVANSIGVKRHYISMMERGYITDPGYSKVYNLRKFYETFLT